MTNLSKPNADVYSADAVIEVLARNGMDPSAGQVQEICTRLNANASASHNADDTVLTVAREVIDERPRIVLRRGAKGSDTLRDIAMRFDQSPFNPRQRIVTEGGRNLALLEASSTPNGGLHVSDIRAVEPGQGDGTRALKIVLALADKHCEEITLTAKAYDSGRERLTTDDLRDWYARHGFVVEGGDEVDGFDMVRPPHPQAELDLDSPAEDPNP
ncbi:hypothetical protein [Burkholderia sp. Tr-20390]|uniref:hypothetical protein n=1 Tax=Burkholderia sp. Tr-20390 TaxID=2703904 RepID=UPI00197F3DDA|nr:hypothetical protein [Burkholderia sp. Tr-20390]MBN3729408.1 hypothetical protein [Burkholderia sp. Tr-20390]